MGMVTLQVTAPLVLSDESKLMPAQDFSFILPHSPFISHRLHHIKLNTYSHPHLLILTDKPHPAKEVQKYKMPLFKVVQGLNVKV